MADVFFGYPNLPSGPGDAMRATARHLREQGIDAVTWQDLRVDGRVVISRILEQINDSACSIFDLTQLNPNVAFELAYAVARGKPVRILLDKSVPGAIANFNELATLKPIGYTRYFNSSQLAANLLSVPPWQDSKTAYDDILEPALPDADNARDALLYCPTYDPFEASSRLSTFIDERRKRGTTLLVSDPKESSFEPITWIAPAIMRSAGVLVHFCGPQRNRATVINTRHAITGGLALGLDTPTLMLAENGYKAPFDFEQHLRFYDYSRQCVQIAREWIDGLEFEGIEWRHPRRAPRNPLTLLKFGEHVAENELDELPEYFVETSAFNDVIDAHDTIFVGHRGTGKTANAFQALDRLRLNKTNLAVLVKPPGFEFPAMFDIMSRLPAAQHDYFFDALWRFVIQTEIGYSVLREIDSRPPTIPLDSAQQSFVDYCEGAAPFDLRADISTRLEQTLDHLAASVASENPSSSRRNIINEAFHTEALNGLRSALGVVLKSRRRVAILVDNLDKGWDKNADLKLMARFILGLLVARGSVVRDFNRQDWWRNRVKLTIAVFLRSDIYHYLRTEAREPDKLPLSTVKWRDQQTLLHVIESRYTAKSDRPGHEVWEQVFPTVVDGQSTRDYICRSIQPRPRDVVVFANAALSSAIDRGNEVVTEQDVIAARSVYSDYAFDALLVENGVTVPELKRALYGFVGGTDVWARSELEEMLKQEGIDSQRIEAVVRKLVSICVLGIEVHPDDFGYPDVGGDTDRAEALAAKLESDPSARRYRIHPAYHPYLETQATTV